MTNGHIYEYPNFKAGMNFYKGKYYTKMLSY